MGRMPRVVVGLSGGVDSAVSAWLLKQQGYEVVAIFMKNWEDDDDSEYCSSNIDFVDAAAVADRIAVLVQGRIVQTGTAEDLIAAPSSPFVAELAGGNLLIGDARLRVDGLTEVLLDGGLQIVSTDEASGPVGVIVHPWEISISRAETGDSAQNHVRAPIESIVPVGNRRRVRVGPLTAEVTEASAVRLRLKEGEVVVAAFKATATRLTPLS